MKTGESPFPDWLVPRLIASLDVSQVRVPAALRAWLADELTVSLTTGLCSLPNGGVSAWLETYSGLRLAVWALTATEFPPLLSDEYEEMGKALESQRRYYLSPALDSPDARKRASNIVQLCDLVAAAMASSGGAHV